MKQQLELRDSVRRIVISCVEEATAQGWGHIQIEQGDAARILSGGRFIDSLGLTSLLVTIEQDLEEELGLTIHLSNAIALATAGKENPLATVGTLIDYIVNYANSMIIPGGV